MKLSVPVGSEVIPFRVTEKMATIRLSLRTSDPSVAKVRQAEVAAFFETVWQSPRSTKPVSLTHQQCVALAGELFRAWTSEGGTTTEVTLQPDGTWVLVEDNFSPPEEWQAALDHLDSLAADLEPESLAPTFEPLIARVLRRRGIGEVDGASRAMLLREFRRALHSAFVVQKRQASGDYTPAPEQTRFPSWEAVSSRKHTEADQKPAGKVSLRGLVGRWWLEAQRANRSQSTLEGYRRSVNSLAAFLKHDDARAVTNDDVIHFKDARIAAGASLKTVKDSDLVALKAVLGCAVHNRLLPSNPAEGIKVLRTKRITTRPNGFTLEEANAILSKSLAHTGAVNEKAQTTAAKRWVPWLCAYTGARVGEIVQLRKEDIRLDRGLWVMTITPEAGTVKDKEAREVVLHPHLVELGFPAFVGSSKGGPLFLAVRPSEDIRGKWRATKNRLAEFAREVVPDERVRPNHGWRHTFVTTAHEAGIEDSVVYAIGGWAPPTVGGRYGNVTLHTQAAAFEKFPRFSVGAP